MLYFIDGGTMLFGVFLVLLGILLILENMGILTNGIWEYIWPIFIILVGISFISRHSPKNGGKL